jgi:transposase
MFQIIRQRCCGLDVHQRVIWACVLNVEANGVITKEKRYFSTMTKGLLQLRDWIEDHDCKDVAIESTGVYWKPVFNILGEEFNMTLANARQVKGLPGRKTDVKDSEWLAQMHLCGLVRASFIPPRPIRDLRDLTRRRRKLVEDANAEKNRIGKYLEDANIKLAAVVSDIWGVSSREILEALISGGYTPEQMAKFARGRMKNKIGELKEALTGKITDHHRFLLTQCMQHIKYLEGQIADLEERIAEALKAYPEVYECLMSVPYLNETSVAGVMAEMGVDMSTFPSASNFAAWSGTCPGNNESAGKRKNGKKRHGNKYLESLLTEISWAAVRRKGSFLQAKFKRIAYRRGPKKAIIAIAHSNAKMLYQIIKERVCYLEPQPQQLSEQQKHKTAQKHLKALERLGYKIELLAANSTPVSALETA